MTEFYDDTEDRIASLEYQLGISDDDELSEEDTPQRRQGVDHKARAQLAELRSEFGGGYENGDQPDDNELALLSQRITDMEQAAGVDLDDDDFQLVGELAQQYGDPQTAFNMVVAESAEATESWERDFEAGVESLEAEVGRSLSKVERGKLYDHHDEVSDPNVADAWKAVYGEDGKGEYDLDTEQGREDYVRDRLNPEDDEPQTVKPLSPDASAAQRREYAATRLDGATVENDAPPVDASASDVEDYIDGQLQ